MNSERFAKIFKIWPGLLLDIVLLYALQYRCQWKCECRALALTFAFGIRIGIGILRAITTFSKQ